MTEGVRIAPGGNYLEGFGLLGLVSVGVLLFYDRGVNVDGLIEGSDREAARGGLCARRACENVCNGLPLLNLEEPVIMR